MLLICAGSNGKNLELAQRLAELGSELEVPCELLDIVSLGWPLYTPILQQEGPPGDFERVAALFHQASAYVLCAPEYNGTIPPAVTSLIAWLSVADEDFRALFSGKPAAIATHSGGSGQKVMVAMRLMLSHLGANVLGREMLCNSQKSLSEETARQLLQQLGRTEV
jgi:NAD(P)H-dependent FMN reductase